MESKCLSFIEVNPKPKTKVYEVRNKLSADLLGYVQWYAPWRKYCFHVYVGSLVFYAGCLTEITNFMSELMQQRRKK